MKSKDKQPQTQVDCKTVACQKVGDLMQLLGGVHYGQFYLSASLRGIMGKIGMYCSVFWFCDSVS